MNMFCERIFASRFAGSSCPATPTCERWQPATGCPARCPLQYIPKEASAMTQPVTFPPVLFKAQKQPEIVEVPDT